MTEPQKIIITGANGFIGSELAAHFAGKGWTVFALIHNMPAKNIQNVIYIKYDLADPVEEYCFEEANYLIHFAYVKHDKKKNAGQLNIDGTIRLLNAGRKHQLQKIIFLSSMSAREDAKSHYGIQKFKLEKLFNTGNDCIIRPGLVIGNGGLLKNMVDFIKKYKIAPLINGGRQPVQTLFIGDLVKAVNHIFLKDLTGKFIVAEKNAVSYREFYTALFAKLGMKSKFLPVSYALLMAVLNVSDRFGIRLPVSKENLLGLKNLSEADVANDLNTLEINPLNYLESIQKTDFVPPHTIIV